MHSNEHDNLEQLLGSLIRMVGKANQTIDSLKSRVNQLENLIREQQLHIYEQDSLSIRPQPAHSPAQELPNTH